MVSLEFVHHKILIPKLIILPHLGLVLQQLHRAHQQVVKVHRIAAPQHFLVATINPARRFRNKVVIHLGLPGQTHRIHQQTFGPGDNTLHRPGVMALGINLGLIHRFLDNGQLVVGVVNGVVGIQAHAIAVTAQHPRAKGVEGTGIDSVGPAADQASDPVLHFPGRLVGESYGGDGIGTHAAFSHQIGNALGDDPGFAASRPGHNQQRALGMQHRFRLGGV